MACEDIEQRLSGLRDDKKELEENLEMPPPHKKDLFEANLNRIKGDIEREEANLADCLAEATAADAGKPRHFGFRRDGRGRDEGHGTGVVRADPVEGRPGTGSRSARSERGSP